MNNGIYIHLPFCLSKCAYCDFNSRADVWHLADDYLEALLGEMKRASGLRADSVYIGGGTPTAFGDDRLKQLLEAVQTCFVLDENSEFTVESNPKTASQETYRMMRACGVNRISLGVQSFVDKELSALSRIHTAKEAQSAVLTAHEAGFSNISLDLMEGIPHQTVESFSDTLTEALKLPVTHISVYALMIEEGTPFYEHTPPLPDEEEERAMHALAGQMLAEHGFVRYEISNYAKDGFRSYHNTKYWTRAPYYGFGAGAHSFYDGVRRANISDVASYIRAADKTCEVTKLTENEDRAERFMLGFRLMEGVRTQGEFSEKLEKLKAQGLITIENGLARLTERGEDVANLVFMEFLGDD